MIRFMRTAAGAAALLIAAAIVGGCASSGGSGNTFKVGVLLYGPQSDGGWNNAFRRGMQEAQAAVGGQLQVRLSANTPSTAAAGQITQELINSGDSTIIDFVGLANIFTGVCAKNPKIHCLQVAAVGKEPANTTGMYSAEWNSHYLAGVAAGLVTKSGTVGFILPFEVPQLIAGVNAYALGCQSVHPTCKVRVVVLNDFFNPPATDQATNSLVDVGADVIRSGVDDPSYCTAAQQRGVYAVGNFSDMSSSCPKAIVTSTVWNWGPFLTSELRSIKNGHFVHHDQVLLRVGPDITLGHFGPVTTASDQARLNQVFAGLANGSINPFVGPLYDQTGKLRVPAGQHLSESFLYSGWPWYVRGVIKGK